MSNQVEFYLQPDDDEAIVDELVRFFALSATPSIHKREETAVKSWENVITIVLSIFGEWAAQRYILDPLAEKVEEWITGVLSVWNRAQSKRSFNIVVRFGQGVNVCEIQVSGTSDEKLLRQVWEYICQAHRAMQCLQAQGVSLDKIRILPSGVSGPLVIGYVGNRPKYILNLKKESISQIQAWPLGEGHRDLTSQLWLLEQLLRHLDYLKDLEQRGYKVSKEQIASLEREVEAIKSRLIPV